MPPAAGEGLLLAFLFVSNRPGGGGGLLSARVRIMR